MYVAGKLLIKKLKYWRYTMSAHMKTLHTELIAKIIWHGIHYALPLKLMEKYRLPNKNKKSNLTIDEAFADLISKHTEPGLLLKGLRHRENLSQIEFSKLLNISQTNLSAMENGRRAIGKELAKRIEAKFNIDYRFFL